MECYLYLIFIPSVLKYIYCPCELQECVLGCKVADVMLTPHLTRVNDTRSCTKRTMVPWTVIFVLKRIKRIMIFKLVTSTSHCPLQIDLAFPSLETFWIKVFLQCRLLPLSLSLSLFSQYLGSPEIARAIKWVFQFIDNHKTVMIIIITQAIQYIYM